jgi:hypothetical protein
MCINFNYYYNYVSYRRCYSAYNFYYNRRGNYYEQRYPNRSFVHRNQGIANRYELDRTRPSRNIAYPNTRDALAGTRDVRNPQGNNGVGIQSLQSNSEGNVRGNWTSASNPRPVRNEVSNTSSSPRPTRSDYTVEQTPRPVRNDYTTTTPSAPRPTRSDYTVADTPRPVRNEYTTPSTPRPGRQDYSAPTPRIETSTSSGTRQFNYSSSTTGGVQSMNSAPTNREGSGVRVRR